MTRVPAAEAAVDWIVNSASAPSPSTHLPTLETKAAALAYSLVMNHPFVDGNKRIGHAVIVFLVLNGLEVWRMWVNRSRFF